MWIWSITILIAHCRRTRSVVSSKAILWIINTDDAGNTAQTTYCVLWWMGVPFLPRRQPRGLCRAPPLVLHVGDTCTLFCMPALVNTFGCTPLYTFIFTYVLLVLNTKLFSLCLFESLGITIEVSYFGNLYI